MPYPKMPNDCRPIEAIDPVTGKTHNVYLRTKSIQETAKRGMGPTRELAFTVPVVLKTPKAIFRGVREEGELSWLCYCGIPDTAYDRKTGASGPSWADEVFLVYVNDDGMIYNWRWEKCDQTDCDLPINYVSRFDERAL